MFFCWVELIPFRTLAFFLSTKSSHITPTRTCNIYPINSLTHPLITISPKTYLLSWSTSYYLSFNFPLALEICTFEPPSTSSKFRHPFVWASYCCSSKVFSALRRALAQAAPPTARAPVPAAASLYGIGISLRCGTVLYVVMWSVLHCPSERSGEMCVCIIGTVFWPQWYYAGGVDLYWIL